MLATPAKSDQVDWVTRQGFRANSDQGLRSVEHWRGMISLRWKHWTHRWVTQWNHEINSTLARWKFDNIRNYTSMKGTNELVWNLCIGLGLTTPRLSSRRCEWGATTTPWCRSVATLTCASGPAPSGRSRWRRRIRPPVHRHSLCYLWCVTITLRKKHYLSTMQHLFPMVCHITNINKTIKQI